MSFICASCKKAQPNGSKPVRVVTATRPKRRTAVKYVEGKKVEFIERGEEIAAEENRCHPCVEEKELKG